MKIRIRAYGPDIIRFIEREHVMELGANSSVDDLAQKLEEEIKARLGWAPNILHSNFTILVNGKPVETLSNRELKDGDSVVVLSPIGGG